MDEKDRQYFIYKILDTWISTQNRMRPWGVWIVEHESLPNQTYELTSDVRNAWFLSDDGIKEMGAWSYVRYLIVQSGKYWYTGCGPCPSNIFSERLRNEIGISGFAKYQNFDDFYLEWQFGGVFGRGYRYSRNSKGILVRSLISVS